MTEPVCLVRALGGPGCDLQFGGMPCARSKNFFGGIYGRVTHLPKRPSWDPRFASHREARTSGRLPYWDRLDEPYNFRGVQFLQFGLLKAIPPGPPFSVVRFDGP